MNSVRRLLTGILNHRSTSAPAVAVDSAATVSSHPYATSGRLSAAPWVGLQVDVAD